MKRVLLGISLLMALSLSACPEPPPAITGKDIIYLSTTDMEYFLKILPEILTFSQQYQSRLTAAQMNDTNYNEQYFQAVIKQDELMKKVLKSGFQDIEHFLNVYISVSMALELQPNNTEDFDKNMADFRVSIKRQMLEVEQLEKSDLKDYEMNILTSKKSFLENQKRLLANIYFIQDYTESIYTAMQEFQQ